MNKRRKCIIRDRSLPFSFQYHRLPVEGEDQEHRGKRPLFGRLPGVVDTLLSFGASAMRPHRVMDIGVGIIANHIPLWGPFKIYYKYPKTLF